MTEYKTGALVRARNRDWIVQPTPDENLLLLKPLGGSDEEITGIYRPLNFVEDKIEPSLFPEPDEYDLGDFTTAKILFNAARLSFRSGAGPFRSLAKLSFRPRSYQIVPLIMALKQEYCRLLIADDVGIGKTPESLLIVKELLERKEINRFAIICPPHLCDQWQKELKEKFDLDAVVIRSNTQARLDRDIHGDISVYSYYPYQVISIDYIKADPRKAVFINECPEVIIVDEAHACAKPSGADKSQHLRYNLLHEIAAKPKQHLILLTATPHSGKAEEFQSLLGLLKTSFEQLDISTANRKEREELAKHFVQRKRADVVHWLDETTLFPKRDAGEIPYSLSQKYRYFWVEILTFAEGLLNSKGSDKRKMRMRYWSALALLRGVMSSPSCGLEMLNRRIGKNEIEEETLSLLTSEDNPVILPDYLIDSDTTPSQIIEKTDWTNSEKAKLKQLAETISQLCNKQDDQKIAYAADIVTKWISSNFHPVIFCRYIATAKYVGDLLQPILEQTFKDVNLQVITSEDADDIRKERIDSMKGSKIRVLVATDCLSEGINLQESFNAVLHYDLPWNPNRLEQREGRVDRFGQTSPEVKAYLLYGKDNPMDGVILNVIIRKVAAIRKDIGVSIPFPEDSKNVMDAVMGGLLESLKRIKAPQYLQTTLFDDPVIKENELLIERAIQDAAKREKRSREIFAQHAIKDHEIEQDLRETDEAIGNPKVVERFVIEACQQLGIQIDSFKSNYKLHLGENIPDIIRHTLPIGNELRITFYSPVVEGYYYLGRNHPFVEQLSHLMLSLALEKGERHKIARASVIKTKSVATKTTILLFRVRNVIGELKGPRELVAEEMLLWGYEGTPEDNHFIMGDDALYYLQSATATAQTTPEQRKAFLKNELNVLERLELDFQKVAKERAEKLVMAHDRFRKALGGNRYKVVEPVLPMDIMGIYILLPDNQLIA
jgi:superfamily II DNA or RNA helicase